MKKTTTFGAITLGASLMMGTAAFADCGDVVIAEMNWASAELMANVDAIILEEGYGCNVDLVPGATNTTFASMNEKAEPDIAGELWINAVREPLEKATAEGRLHSVIEGPITGLGEGWWVSPAFVEAHPELDTVEKVLARPDLFPDAEDPSKGAFLGCPAGWGCQLSNSNLFRAFDMEAKGWTLVDPGSAAGLDGSIAKAVERGENWFGYYWAPTAIIGKYELTMLDWETPWGGSENWDGCIVKPEQECLEPQMTSYTESEVHSVVTDRFLKEGGVAVDYLKTRVFPGEVMNAMLVYMNDNQATGGDAAWHFLETYPEIWGAWVSEDAATAIKKEL
ncbi:glycine betaine ABC transporter substrate-binding protein [Thalassobius sp. Cn5-15]|uniref:glycine betaine ABC transporter substrate-binding protein n=1 Tax=Thalassobius sp. Cn5-15 TaxID=2917763 RepID=UPI001EF218A1|nr:glycine betaine ABC transporter substrate-binding protein [Thalassobius sp. Cn5-15]MCG7493071.1 ABC transporter substrate-binding protein [Thalassobius sp. Cn5-15]